MDAIPFNQAEYKEGIVNRVEHLTKIASLKLNYLTFEAQLTKRYTEAQRNAIKSLREVLEDMYPGEYDIQPITTPIYHVHENTYGGNHSQNEFELFDHIKVIDTIRIVIKFPEVTITNGLSNLLIRDLFMGLRIKINPLTGKMSMNEVLSGVRTTFTATEFKKKYQHSHLMRLVYKESDSSNLDKFKKEYSLMKWDRAFFCLGESDTNMAKQLLNAEWTEDNLVLFLHGLRTYIEWESEAGGPFITLKDIAPRKYNLDPVKENKCLEFIQQIKYKLMERPIDVDWKVENGKAIVIANDKFDTFVANLYPSKAIYHKDERGVLYLRNDGGQELYIPPGEHWIPFRQEKVWLNILDDSHLLLVNNQQKYIHPKYTGYVKSRFEYYANKSQVKQSGLSKLQDTSNNHRRITG